MLERIRKFIEQNKEYVIRPRNMKLFIKFLAALYLVSIISLSIGLVSYFQGKNYLEKQAITFYETLTNSKKNALETYFTRVKNQLLSNSQSISVVDAIKGFTKGYYEFTGEIDRNKRDLVIDFYNQKFKPDYKYNTLYQDSLESLEGQLNQQSIVELHYHYLAHNINPIGLKYQLNKVDDSAYYHKVHSKYHNYFTSLKQNFDFYDIFLIDNKGNLVYSVSKEVDFAHNLFNGPFKSSNAASLFRDIIKNAKKGEVKLADYANYSPSYNYPAMFAATALYDQEDKKIGVLMFQIPSQKIDNLLSGNQSWEKEGLKELGEVALIGPDFLIRNNTRSMQTNIIKYTQDLLKSGEDSMLVERIKRLKTTILLRKITNKVGLVNDGMKGKSGVEFDIDFRGNRVLDVYAPIDVIDKRWVIFTEISTQEIFEDVNSFFFYLVLGFIIIFILITIIGYRLARELSRPIQKIKRDITLLSKGQLPQLKKFFYKDEIGEVRQAVNDLTLSIEEITNFAENIGKGNFDYEFEAKSQDDFLGLALIDMRNNLKKVNEDEKIRNWINTGNAHFSEILRENSDDLENLGKVVVAELVKYVDALQAAIFLKDDKKDILNILSTYAFDRHKYLDKEMKIGEGLVGQCFAEKESIYLLDIPDNYSPISSGLGEAQPKCLFLVPIQNEEDIYGVLEVASFNNFKDIEKNLIEGLAKDIATTIASLKRNLETKELLKASEERYKKQRERIKKDFVEQQIMLKKENSDLKDKISELEEKNKELEKSIKVENNLHNLEEADKGKK